MSEKKMHGVVVHGTIGLLDATVVQLIHDLQHRYGSVWLGEVSSAFAELLDESKLRYVFGRLKCVAGTVSHKQVHALELPRCQFPETMVAATVARLTAGVPVDDPQPPAWTVQMLRAERPRPLVMLSGCFDLIHAGHVRLIELAGRFGPSLIVAALSSRAIRDQPKNQNRERPLWSMQDRLTVLEDLRDKPRVLFFDGPDCLGLISQIQPDVFVKEQRDRARGIVQREAQLVERLGGRVVWLDSHPYDESSSTQIANGLLKEM